MQARISIDLSTVPDRVHTIALAGSVGTGTFGDIGKLALHVIDPAGHSLAEYLTADADTESAFVFGEVYRRDGVWKVRAVGQGWDSGLSGLATDFGVSIDDAEPTPVDVSTEPAPPEEISGPVPTPTRASGVRTAKRPVRRAKPIEFRQAEAEGWQPARLFSVIGVGAGELPVQVDRRKLTKVALRHLSWAEVAHEARMLLSHGGIDDPLQSWVLAEFLRFLDHPRSGAAEFVDMGRHWVTVRDAVTSGTLRAGDQKALAVADTWVSLGRHLALRLAAEMGVEVKHVLARKHRADPAARAAAVAERLATDGSFEAVLRIPDTAGDLTVIADIRTNKVRCRTTIAAPDEGTAARRVSWLTKQLTDAPGNLQIEAVFSERGNETCELLDTVRTSPKSLTEGRTGSIVSFTLEQTFPMGNKRSGTAASFITSVTSATDAFYGTVVQPLREWVPAARSRPTSCLSNQASSRRL